MSHAKMAICNGVGCVPRRLCVVPVLPEEHVPAQPQPPHHVPPHGPPALPLPALQQAVQERVEPEGAPAQVPRSLVKQAVEGT